jgi:hypothetical protein
MPLVAAALEVDVPHFLDVLGDGGGDRPSEGFEVLPCFGHLADPDEADG